MDTLIQGGKYQVIEVLVAEEGYRACLCIDVETNNHFKPMIFNIYEKDDVIRRLLPTFFDMQEKQYSELIRVMSGQHSITAVFEYNQGTRLAEYFRRLDKGDFEQRCKYASLLLEECLILDAAPDFIAFECLEPDNIVILEKAQKVKINYIIKAREVSGNGFKGKRLASLLELIFVKNRYVPDRLWDYIEDLKANKYGSIVGAFSQWKEINIAIAEEHKALKKEALTAYLIRWAKRRLIKKK